MSKRQTEVAVIGAGVIGSAVAYYAAKAGFQVALIDAGDSAQFTSSRCDGNVLVSDKMPGYDTSLTARSQELLDELSDELDYDFQWERRGSMLVMENEQEMEMGQKLCEDFKANGITGVHMMDPNELAQREPYLARDLAGGMWFDGDGCLYPMGLCYGLAEGLKKYRGELLLHQPVTMVKKSGKGFVLSTPDYEIWTERVVNCAGIQSARVGAMSGIEIPVKPRQGQILVSEPTVQLAKQKVMEFGYMMAKFQSSDYVRPVTSLMEKYGVALVYEPTGGNNFLLGSSRYFTDMDDVKVDIEVMKAIALRGIRFFPAMADVKVIRSYAGISAYTPDHMPIISDTVVDGYYVATGHEGDGVGLSAITGVLMTQLLSGEVTEFDMEPLRLSRF